MHGIRKSFPEVVAVDGVDFSAEGGEIVGLLGENGAGKSTLMGLLYGVYKLDEGNIEIEGKPAKIKNSSDAIKLGLGMVHQAFTLVPNMTVWENIVLGSEPTRMGALEVATALKRVSDLMDSTGLHLEEETFVESLPTGFKQRVEILKALYRGARVLILDEPTAVLTPPEVDELFRSIRKLADSGSTVIFITHKLKEVIAVTNRITVMRKGKVVATVKTSEVSLETLANLMVGREVERKFVFKNFDPGETLLAVKDLVVATKLKPRAVDGCSFSVREGEIVGIAGVEGNGQTELVEAIMGLRRPSAGAVEIKGRAVNRLSTRDVMGLSVAHIPEDRALSGLVLDFSIAENSVLGSVEAPKFSRAGLISARRVTEFARRIIDKFNVATRSVQVRARNLSGGNQQKVIVGRELSSEPHVLIAHQPTRGLDITSTEYIQSLLVDARNSGRGVLLVSADFDEILDLSDRILVLYEGRILGELKRGASIGDLAKLIGGVLS